MQQQIAISGETMPALDRRTNEITRTLVCWTPSDPTKPVELTRYLSETERAQIRRRAAELRSSLEARDLRLSERNVTAMLLTFPSGRATGEEARMVRAAYVQALADLPPWAISEATNRWARGTAGAENPAFAPSAAEIHKLATAVLAPVRIELAKLERILVGVVAPRLTIRPREEQQAIESHARETAAVLALEARAVALGIADPKEALAKIPNAPPRDLGALQHLSANPMPAGDDGAAP